MSAWGPWIDHGGKGCPCIGQWVQAVDRVGSADEFVAGTQCIVNGVVMVIPHSVWDRRADVPNAWAWAHRPPRRIDIIRYRIRRPMALDICREIAALKGARVGA